MEELIQTMENNVGIIILAIFIFSMGLAIGEFCYELYKKKINKWRLGEMWASFSVFTMALTERQQNLLLQWFTGSLKYLYQARAARSAFSSKGFPLGLIS